jgi:hypothetical protein
MTKRLVVFALAAITLAATPQSLKAADADALCPLGNATLSGTYMLRGEGTIVGVGPVTVKRAWRSDPVKQSQIIA